MVIIPCIVQLREFSLLLNPGCPRIIRADRGTENSTVAFLQPFLRRNGRDRLSKENSFQFGRSATNQVKIAKHLFRYQSG